MKIYLLDIDKSMTDIWKREFNEIENLEIINDNFNHFMDTHEDIDGIVSPANSFGIMTGGYDKAIIDYLGERAQTNVYTILDILFDGYQPIGTCCPIVFDKYTILHTPTMRTPEEIIDQRVVFDCMLSCLNCAKKSKLESIVIPAFGACTGKVPKNIVAELMRFAYDIFINDVNESFTTDNWKYARYISNTLNNIISEVHNLNRLSASNCITDSLAIDRISLDMGSTQAVNTIETNSLSSLEEYIKNNDHIQKQVSGMIQDFSEPKYKCPKCGGSVRKNLTMVLTSLPPKYRYECDQCDYVDFHEF